MGRLGLVERRYREDLSARAQALQRGEDVSLPIAQVRSYLQCRARAFREYLPCARVRARSAAPELTESAMTSSSYHRRGAGRRALYPYVLDPKLTTQVWGGDELVKVYGKQGDPNARLGESWECWDEDRVRNGALAGSTVAGLRARLGAELLGDLDPKRIFPVLTKIITAHDWLSVQVHPDDAYAQRVEHQPFGKTECWYVLDAQPNAQIVYGWNRDTSRAEYGEARRRREPRRTAALRWREYR